MGMRITIQNKSAESAPIIVDLNDKSEEAISGAEIANTFLGGNVAMNGASVAGKMLARYGTKAAGVSLASTLSSMGLGTILTSAVSCGTFEKGNDILESEKCIRKIKAFEQKYPASKNVTPEDVKKDPRAKTKSGFWNWLFTGNVSGKRVTTVPKHDILVKKIGNVTIAVTTLTPFFGSTDLRQLAGERILIVTGFYLKANGTIGSKNLCRGYLKRGGSVNKSGESINNEISFESILEPIIDEMREQAIEGYYNMIDNK